jgi:hypothetical protein
MLARTLQAARRTPPRAAALSVGPSPDPGAPSGAADASAEQHWLDRRLPGARPWLESKNREWWIKGVEARCRQVAC